MGARKGLLDEQAQHLPRGDGRRDDQEDQQPGLVQRLGHVGEQVKEPPAEEQSTGQGQWRWETPGPPSTQPGLSPHGNSYSRAPIPEARGQSTEAPRHLWTLPDMQPGRGEEGARDPGLLRRLGMRVRGSSTEGPRAPSAVIPPQAVADTEPRLPQPQEGQPDAPEPKEQHLRGQRAAWRGQEGIASRLLWS